MHLGSVFKSAGYEQGVHCSRGCGNGVGLRIVFGSNRYAHVGAIDLDCSEEVMHEFASHRLPVDNQLAGSIGGGQAACRAAGYDYRGNRFTGAHDGLFHLRARRGEENHGG